MRNLLLLTACLLLTIPGQAQIFRDLSASGIYLQWGYNRDWYTKSDIRVYDGKRYDFTIYDVVAKDKPDFSYYRQHPADITIPQNSYRIGLYLNKKRTHAIEINYDHAKYVQVDGQTLHMRGVFDGKYVNADTNLGNFLVHIEHTNGANFYHLNYMGMHELGHFNKRPQTRAYAIWRAGAGVVIPKSFVVINYQKLDNKFHVAGYIISSELGSRFYPFRNFFLEATAKGGFANYLDALAIGDGRVSHHFWYGEVVGTFGFDLNFDRRWKKQAAKE